MKPGLAPDVLVDYIRLPIRCRVVATNKDTDEVRIAEIYLDGTENLHPVWVSADRVKIVRKKG